MAAQSFASSKRGFTLIELLVVISIMAVLAVIGASVYSGIQAGARDAQRRAEITQIGKSIEASKNSITNTYTYSTVDLANDFARSQRTNPINDGNGLVYCVRTSTSTGLNTVAGTNWTGATAATCDTTNNPSYGPLNTSITAPGSATPNLLYNGTSGSTADVKSWILCASMEKSQTPFCVKSQQ